MAINAVREWHPHLGSIWVRMVELWAAYVRNEALTCAITTTTASSFRAVRFDVSDAVDTTRHDLVDGSQFSADNQWISKMPALPGWYAEAPIQPIMAGLRNVETDWTNNMHAARRAIWTAWCAAPTLGSDANTLFTTSGLAVKQKITNFIVRRGATWLFDWTAVPTLEASATDYAYLDQPVCNGVPNPSLTLAVAGGGGSTDLTPLVEAVQDIAHMTNVATLNNGAVQVILNSGEIITP